MARHAARAPTSTLGILRRHVTARRAPSILLGVLVAIAVLIVAIAPRALTALSDQELRSRLDRFGATQPALTATGPYGMFSDGDVPADELLNPTGRILDLFPSTIPAPLGPALGEPEWFLELERTPTTNRDPDATIAVTVNIIIDQRYRDHIEFVEGAAPAPWTGSLADDLVPADRPPLEIAVSRESARALELAVGDVLDGDGSPLLVSGIWDPVDPADLYWVRAADLIRPETSTTLSGIRLGSSDVYVDTESAMGLGPVLDRADIDATYPLVSDELSFDEATTVADQLRKATSLGLFVQSGNSLRVQSVLHYELARIQQGIASLSALLALSLSAPLGMLGAVVVLGARSVVRARAGAITLASARGMSDRRLRGLLALEGLVIAIPATAAALVAASVAFPTTTQSLTVPVAICLSVPVLFAVLTSPRRLAATRMDGAATASGRPRVFIEIATIGITAIAVLLLFRRGLLESGAEVGVDPLLAAVPLLLALSTCVVVLRVYPRLLLWLQRRVRRQNGPVGILGIARAVRDPALGFSSVLAVVIGVSAVVFSLVMVSTVSAALLSAARQEVGGDLRVEGVNGTLPTDLAAEIGGIDGVATATAVQEVGGSKLSKDGRASGITLVLADTASLPLSLPDLASPADGPVPFLQSSDISAEPDAEVQLNDEQASYAGSIDVDALPVARSAWALVDASFSERLTGGLFAPQQVLVTLDDNADKAAVVAALEQLAPDTSVSAASDVLHVTQSRPAIVGLTIALLAGAILSFVLCALTVVVSAVTAAASRSRTVGVMRLLGMPSRRGRSLLGWELAPVTATAVLAGTALGLALPYLLGAAVDLRTFSGGSIPVVPSVPVALVAAATVGFAAFVALTAIVASIRGARADLATTARLGAE